MTKIFPEATAIRNKLDSGLLLSIILLLGLGLVTLYITSASYAYRVFDKDELYFVRRQTISALIGILLMLICTYINFDIVRKLLPVIFIGCFILCILTFLPGIGDNRNGARRWIKVPGIGTFQPSEAAKIVIILFLSNLFSKKLDRLDESNVTILPAAFGLFAFVLIVFLQSDFSTAFFLMLVGFSIFFISGVFIRWFLAFCVFSVPIIILFIFSEQYRVERLIAFFKPNLDLHGDNYQVNTAKKAIISGGVWGEGIGSRLARVTGIPEVQTDFVFAGWAEAMGLIGVILIFALFVYFAYKGFSIAYKCNDPFRSFTAFGLTTSIFLQALLNCAVVCGAIPATGIPLPFFSAGGSSLVVTLVMCGFLLNISKYKGSLEGGYER